MTRINLFRTTPSTLKSVAWGKANFTERIFNPTASRLIFAALLLACSLTVACSSEPTKPASSASPVPTTQPAPAIATAAPPPAAVPALEAKPGRKKIVHKAPATLTYADKNSGVSFQYPRRYALKTGDAATELVSSGPIPMDFKQPGGIALAAVALPDSMYPDSDLASAFFNVSVNKTLTAGECSEFSVLQGNPAAPADPAVQTAAPVATPPISKLMIGDMELVSGETSTGGPTPNGPREETSRYYHVFQNGACYEFALKVATRKPDAATTAESGKRVDREEVFHRLEKILASVKINPAAATEASAEVKTTSGETPAQ